MAVTDDRIVAPTDNGDELAPTPAATEWGDTVPGGATWKIYHGDAKRVVATFPSDHFDCVVTSPPYFWQRDYEVDGQIGMEATIEAYVDAIKNVMDEVFRVLNRTGVMFLNLGDTYYSAKGQPKGSDPKNAARRFGLRAVDASGLGLTRKTLLGIPWRIALALITEGWVLRSPIIWQREASLPEPSARDRPWRTYETVFMFSKSPRYHFVRGNLGDEEDVWTMEARPSEARGVHRAAFPDQFVAKCLSLACPEGGRVLDPFAGSGTVLRVALQTNRHAVGIDLNPQYCEHMVQSCRQLGSK